METAVQNYPEFWGKKDGVGSWECFKTNSRAFSSMCDLQKMFIVKTIIQLFYRKIKSNIPAIVGQIPLYSILESCQARMISLLREYKVIKGGERYKER